MMKVCRVVMGLSSLRCANALALGLSRRDVVVGGGLGGAALLVGESAGAAVSIDAESRVRLRSGVLMPRVGFGLYKTPSDEAFEGTRLALAAGVRHFDTAASYGNEEALGEALRASSVSRDEIFVSTKATPREVEAAGGAGKALEASLRRLGLGRVECFSLHSPLCPRADRLRYWGEIHDARTAGLTRSAGVANFGARHLDELSAIGPPDLVQLEVSPYNQRREACAWANRHGARVSCGAWSKLSGGFNWGDDAAYKTLSAAAKHHGATKAQVLVRWSVQRGFAPLPRSGTAEKETRLAIAQNSGRGVENGDSWKNGPLSPREMASLDGLDVALPSGRLGRADGWAPEDILSPSWDPTTYVE